MLRAPIGSLFQKFGFFMDCPRMSRIMGTFYEDQRTFVVVVRSFLLRLRYVVDTLVDKIKTHILLSKPCHENCAVYEIMWKNIIETDRPQMTIPHMYIACWITKATETHSEYVILISFHGNNGYANAHHCYVISILPVLFLSPQPFWLSKLPTRQIPGVLAQQV
jgi:hypothetical protein